MALNFIIPDDVEDRNTRRYVTLGMFRAHMRAAHDPDRIVTGQVGISHATAKCLVEAGWWELGDLEYFKNKVRLRYRMTELGREIAKEHGA